MCGIAGIVSSRLESDLDARLSRLRSALSHRGPDDYGVFTARMDAATCGLVHTRLSILDLSPAGHQPMSTPDGRFTITFNGEIYNFESLRAELESQGVLFHSHSDTEVVLHLYQREGKSMARRLRGMFAFAIWDDEEKSLFTARDPLGIKPFYYSCSSGHFVFASEVRALIASGVIPQTLSPEGLHGYFRLGTVPEPHTLFAEIKSLSPGASGLWNGGVFETERFWSMPFGTRKTAPPCVNHLASAREALIDTVNAHFVSDVPVGIFLSGGIDSTALVALARAAGQKNIHTFSIGFEERKYDESDLAVRTAQHFNTDHKTYIISATEGQVLFGEYLEAIDQPTNDGFNMFCVSKFAHDENMKVVLSGLGGDELFGGYPSFQMVPRMRQWYSRIPSQILRNSLGRTLEALSSNKGRRIGQFLQTDGGTSAAMQCFRGFFSSREADKLVERLAGVNEASFHPTLNETEVENPLEAVSLHELQHYMRNQLLRDADVMSMHWGLELRVPFVDRVLFETLAEIPPYARIRPGKQLLIDAVPEIPAWILNQPKRGFTFPFESWLGDEWEQMFSKVEEAAGLRMDHWSQKWIIFVLQHCLQRIENGLPSN